MPQKHANKLIKLLKKRYFGLVRSLSVMDFLRNSSFPLIWKGHPENRKTFGLS